MSLSNKCKYAKVYYLFVQLWQCQIKICILGKIQSILAKSPILEFDKLIVKLEQHTCHVFL